MTEPDRNPSLPIAVAVASLLAFAGCSASESGPDAGSPDAGEQDAGPCPPSTHRTEFGCDSTMGPWVPMAALAQKRDHHASFIAQTPAGAFLFTLGGVVDRTSVINHAERNQILADGTVEVGAQVNPLPVPTAGIGVALVGTTVVVTGGHHGSALSSNVDVTQVTSTGTLGTWSAGPAMSMARFHHAQVAVGQTVWAIGGMTGDNTDNTPTVERAAVDGTGALGGWQADTPLPQKRSHHAAVVHGGFVYVLGGLQGDPAGTHTALSDVLRATISEAGIGAWEKVSDLPHALSTHAAFVHGNHVYVAGGIDGTETARADVWRARLRADGGLGAWELVEVAGLPAPLSHAHHAPVHNGFVYLAGGAVNQLSVDQILGAKFE